ncbi:MAG TPA: EVE domain-containing protein [Casimicrobiaceae bacterium]|nr:EVE domain-containing protein [Casimicrobiaceae bacterium]
MIVRNYWVGVVSRDHVALGVSGSFTQLNHGRAGPLERMRAGDGFAFYSPRTSHPHGPALQAFTAIGRIRDGTVYQARHGNGAMENGAASFRLDVDYLPAREAPIRPLIEALSFIRSKTHWGAAFRFGFLRVPEEDFALIATAMGRDFGADFPPAAAAAGAPAAGTGGARAAST